MLTTLAIAILILLVAWRVGAFALRVGGVVLVLVGLVMVAAGVDPVGATVAIVLGVISWLGGHWLYALRHHEYRGALAERIFLQLLPDRLDPTRGWIVPTSGEQRQPPPAR
jgi:hypothetical protein